MFILVIVFIDRNFQKFSEDKRMQQSIYKI